MKSTQSWNLRLKKKNDTTTEQGLIYVKTRATAFDVMKSVNSHSHADAFRPLCVSRLVLYNNTCVKYQFTFIKDIITKHTLLSVTKWHTSLRNARLKTKIYTYLYGGVNKYTNFDHSVIGGKRDSSFHYCVLFSQRIDPNVHAEKCNCIQ